MGPKCPIRDCTKAVGSDLVLMGLTGESNNPKWDIATAEKFERWSPEAEMENWAVATGTTK